MIERNIFTKRKAISADEIVFWCVLVGYLVSEVFGV